MSISYWLEYYLGILRISTKTVSYRLEPKHITQTLYKVNQILFFPSKQMNIGDDAKDKAMSLGDNIIEQKVP